jgi:hypothetical protein
MKAWHSTLRCERFHILTHSLIRKLASHEGLLQVDNNFLRQASLRSLGIGDHGELTRQCTSQCPLRNSKLEDPICKEFSFNHCRYLTVNSPLPPFLYPFGRTTSPFETAWRYRSIVITSLVRERQQRMRLAPDSFPRTPALRRPARCHEEACQHS